MNNIMRYLGWPLLCAGVLLLVVGYPTGLNNSNAYLLLSLAAVLAGAVICVRSKKRDSEY